MAFLLFTAIVCDSRDLAMAAALLSIVRKMITNACQSGCTYATTPSSPSLHPSSLVLSNFVSQDNLLKFPRHFLAKGAESCSTVLCSYFFSKQSPLSTTRHLEISRDFLTLALPKPPVTGGANSKDVLDTCGINFLLK